MESIDEQIQLDSDKVTRGTEHFIEENKILGFIETAIISDGVINMKAEDNTSDSDSEDVDAFFNDLFTDVTPTYISTDTVPWLDDSDGEAGTSDTVVKFYVDKSNSIPLAQYDGTEYRIGFLDLTQEEYSCLGIMSETTVELSVNEKCIQIVANKFYIKRLHERQDESTNPNHIIESWFDRLKLKCVKFSMTEPLLAKYENDIYFVGEKLSNEYSNLLHRTHRKTGTAIRIHMKRLKIDELNQILDVHRTHSFKTLNEITIITGSNDLYKCPKDFYSNEFSRFVISSESCLLLKVDSQLIYTSISDDCTEIYAEVDFPLNDTEKSPQTIEISMMNKDLKKKSEKKEKKKEKEKKRKANKRKDEVESNDCE